MTTRADFSQPQPPLVLDPMSSEAVSPVFSIRIKGYPESYHAIGKAAFCRHAALAHAKITGHALKGSPLGAFEIVSRDGNMVTIQLLPGVETQPLPTFTAPSTASGDTHFIGKGRRGGTPDPDTLARHMSKEDVRPPKNTFVSRLQR